MARAIGKEAKTHMWQVAPTGPSGLRQILPDAKFHGAPDVVFSGCCDDSRLVRPGDLFVARMGVRHDGHDHVADAISRGCVAVLAEREVPTGGAPLCLVHDSRAAFGALCQWLRGNPSQRLKVVGVTGTNGKTTTSLLIAGILSEARHRLGILGTLGYTDSVQVCTPSHTTPPAPVIADWLSRMVDSDCSHAVMEVSSHALSQRRIAGVELDVACVTNVRRDHLDYHGTAENYARAKSRIFEHLRPEGLVVLNADDPVSQDYLRELHCPVLTVAMQREAEITATVIERHSSEQTFLIHAGSETAAVRTRMIGDHHVYNCLVAAAVGLGYGVDLSTVVRGIESVGHIPGRLDRIECGQPFNVFVDYAHTPDALQSVLTALRQVTAGRVICVFGAGGNRDAAKRPLMGRTVEQHADQAIITTDNPRHEDPQKIALGILAGFQYPSRVQMVADRARAIETALAAAGPDDCVLIAGKGHEQTQTIGSNQVAFDDADVARHWLYNVHHEPASTPHRRRSYFLSNS